MVKIKWVLAITLLGTIMLSACTTQLEKNISPTPIQSVNSETLSEKEIINSVKTDIRKITNQDLLVFWQNVKGDNVFSIAYVTIYDPQKAPEEFIAEFNQVVLTGGKWFAQSSTNSPIMIVFAELINSPVSKENPPLREVVVEKEKAIEWSNGKISVEEFIASWLVVPLPNQ